MFPLQPLPATPPGSTGSRDTSPADPQAAHSRPGAPWGLLGRKRRHAHAALPGDILTHCAQLTRQLGRMACVWLSRRHTSTRLGSFFSLVMPHVNVLIHLALTPLGPVLQEEVTPVGLLR